MGSFFRWLWNGFGTRTTAGQAVGITLCIMLAGVYILYIIVRTIVRAVRSHKANTAQGSAVID